MDCRPIGRPRGAGWALAAWLLAVSPAASRGSTGLPDSLPFRPLAEPTDHFTVSDLTDDYEKKFVPIQNLTSPPRRLDLDAIEAQSRWTQAAADSVARADSTAHTLFDASRARDAANLPPEEREAMTRATAGVRVGLPGPTAAITAFAGGLGLLVKFIYEMSR